VPPDTLGRVPCISRARPLWRADRHDHGPGLPRVAASPARRRRSGRGGSRDAPAACAGRWGVLVLCLVGVLLFAGSTVSTVVAATPSPEVVPGGDTRSEGEGAGLVGSPVLVALGVIALGVAAAGATTLYLRLTREE
jgi:hypothetical protein